VQIAIPGEIDIVDTLAAGVEASRLAAPFADPSIRKIFHDAQGDLRMLSGHRITVRGLFDTQRAATLLGLPKVGLGNLVEERFGVRLAKEHQTADFGQRPLPEELQSYIADDVRYLLPLAEELEREIRGKDIWEEFQLENERIATEASEPEPLPRPRLPGPARDALGLAIAEMVDSIRYEEAEARDLPVGRVLSNAAVGEIAARRPKTLRELISLQGVKGSFTRPRGDEVIDAIARLREMDEAGKLPPAPALPRPDPTRRKREEKLRAWRNEAAQARGVTPMVVLPTPLMDQLAAQPPAGLEELGALRWLGEKRLRLYGAQLLQLLRAD
jgi:ribonuclease D